MAAARPIAWGIFRGTIAKWSDPRIARTNPGVKPPNLTITTVVRRDSSGTTFAFPLAARRPQPA